MLMEKLVYSIDCLKNLSYDMKSNNVILEISEGEDEFKCTQIINQLEREIKQVRVFPDKVLVTNKVEDITKLKHASTNFNPFIRKQNAIKVEQCLRNHIMQFSKDIASEVRRYPSMIPFSVLEKCDYIGSFPQNLLMISEFPHDKSILEEIRVNHNTGPNTRLSEYVLSPAVCFHCYEEMSNQTIQTPLVFDMEGNCFRHEAPWRVGKHRLREFTMREIVYFGTPTYVEETRRNIMNLVWDWFNELGLIGSIVTASDPFYYSEDSNKGQHQIFTETKYELVADILEGDEVVSFSIASFNNVRETLCDKFNIKDNKDELLFSGCVAFGIDRWVYVLLAKYGDELECWPEKIKDILFI